ncbi:MAG: 16S rRNA (guanine(527)-N(7))-methyltransferase RsmG [Planctomycetota bacterium]|nr:16S rRNA (guanine(527)-N(7))-methyltransferase RsmG [Planctomycetota bacterium]
MTQSTDPVPVPEAFLEAASAMGVVFDTGDLERLSTYLGLLYAANEHMNLTAIRTPEEAWTRHILDSLSLLPVLSSVTADRIIDIGSGGGLPGIPLAITTPESRFVLLEATGKKADFLRDVVQKLDLGNVRIAADRAETAAAHGNAHRGAFDVVIARAVGPMPVLLELAIPFARVNGILVAIKGGQAAQEIEDAADALMILHSEVVEQRRTSTGTIVVVRKNKSTPRQYPRRPGEPKRRPLGTDASDMDQRRVR